MTPKRLHKPRPVTMEERIRKIVRDHLDIKEPVETPEEAARRIADKVFADIPKGAFRAIPKPRRGRRG